MNTYSKQVDSEYYNFSYYMDAARWMSYYEQIKLFHSLEKNSSVLEIGAGLSLNKEHIEEHLPSLVYKTLDIAEDLEPDYVGSAHDIPIDTNSFDAVVAFEVLEHLPFEEFEKALLEMKRVSKSTVIVSLPHFGPPIKFLLKIPFVKEFKFAIKIPYRPTHVFNGQHYWEIGKKGYSPKFIRSVFKKHFELVDEFIPFDNQYHHFFVLKVSK